VILLDANVVVASYRADLPQHRVTRPWLDNIIRHREPFAVPDEVWSAFIRIITNRRIFDIPTPRGEAFEFISAVRDQPAHVPVSPGPRRFEIFQHLCEVGEASGDLIPDAFLAALAIEQGATLVSFDRDFARFPGLRWNSPAAP